MATPLLAPLSHDAALYAIHHIVLPSKLPQADDYDPKHDEVLLEVVHRALDAFRALSAATEKGIIDPVIDMVSHLREIRTERGSISQEGLKGLLSRLFRKKGKCLSIFLEVLSVM